MLSKTFLHLPTIGPATEKRIWERGLHSWKRFLLNPAAAGFSPTRTERIVELVAYSQERLNCEDHRYFASSLSLRDHWRAFPEFRHRIAYLDIETTGMSDDDQITLIGLYNGRHVRIYTKGEDLQEFADDIGDYRLLVTFFGSCFDVPFLSRRFPYLRFDQLHIDLCHLLRRLGLTGGLKNIEHRLGFSRSPETEGLDGWDAVRLWREWERGSRESLDLLKAYNREDIVNLEKLLLWAYPRLHTAAGIPE